jgi:hypothetical protein
MSTQLSIGLVPTEATRLLSFVVRDSVAVLMSFHMSLDDVACRPFGLGHFLPVLCDCGIKRLKHAPTACGVGLIRVIARTEAAESRYTCLVRQAQARLTNDQPPKETRMVTIPFQFLLQ